MDKIKDPKYIHNEKINKTNKTIIKCLHGKKIVPFPSNSEILTKFCLHICIDVKILYCVEKNLDLLILEILSFIFGDKEITWRIGQNITKIKTKSPLS